MTWTPRADWINVQTDPRVSPHAVGDGITDDTAAIQSALDILTNNPYTQQDKTVYFPAGTYKISATLKTGSAANNVSGYNLIGCGINTVIKWYGASGGAMMWPDGASSCRFLGLVWDGNNIAGCGIEIHSDGGYYMTQIRHENESFRNFVVNGTYPAPDPNHVYPSGFPPSAIISGFSDSTAGEVTIFNCCFNTCSNAIYVPVEQFQNFMWLIDGCEFDNNTIGFSGGGNASGGGNFIIMNSHFQGSTSSDIGYDSVIHAQRLTSSGSAMFANVGISGTSFRDCWVDGWTNPFAAINFIAGGQGSVVDCNFTHPPAGASAPLYMHVNTGGQLIDLLLSNNYAPDFSPGVGIVDNTGVPPIIDVVPPGSMNGNLTSATQTFLKSATVADSTHILDVTKSPYNAVPGFGDSTATIQAAITDAATANNGSIVYLPGGFYAITGTLNLPAGNYTVEGEGVATQICWIGGSNNTMMTVTNPTTLTVRQLVLSAAWNMTGTSGYNSAFPVCDSSTITALKETSTSGTSNVTYDNVIVNSFGYGNPGATGSNIYSPGLVLSGLPATATVYIPVMNSPLTVIDCGQAKIYSRMAYMGLINVSGATHPKTGFLGLGVAEGGQDYGFSGGANNGLANITVNDNQNLLVGAYYTEEEGNDVSLLRGAGTIQGQVAIEGMNATSSATPSSTMVNVNNYAGRFFYGSSSINNNWASAPVQVQQTGSNPLDMMFALNFFDGGSPTFTLGAGANLIATLNQYRIAGSGPSPMTDTPNPLTTANYISLASSMDDFRQLGALNLAVEYGNVNPSGLVAYWKLDETAGPSIDSSMSGITGTWQNSPTSTTDHPSSIPYADPGAISFNGINQCISMGNPANLPTGYAPRSICGWAKASDTSGSYLFFASFGTNTWGNGMFIGMDGTTLYAGAGQGDDLTFPNFWDDKWHFIALTYDGTTAKLYADGVLKTSALKSDWNLIPNACYVGCQADHTQFWPGSVDDVRIYNRALSAAEVGQLAGITPQPSGPVAYWTLDEETGTTSHDSSGNGLDGTWENGPTFSTDHPSAITFPDAGCLTFDGNQLVSISNIVPLPSSTHARTICGWAKPSDLNNNNYRWIANLGTNAYGEGMFIGMYGTTLYTGSGYGDDITIPNFWDNKWHFIALTYDGTTANLYADGVLLTSQSEYWDLVPDVCNLGEGWIGQIDDVRIYDRALSATEISHLATGNQ